MLLTFMLSLLSWPALADPECKADTFTGEKLDRPEFCRHSVAALRVAPFKLYR